MYETRERQIYVYEETNDVDDSDHSALSNLNDLVNQPRNFWLRDRNIIATVGYNTITKKITLAVNGADFESLP